MNAVLACIVEGHGDVAAIPLLIRRVDAELHVPRPIRVKRQKVVLNGELERYLSIAEANIVDGGGAGAVLLVLDADADCAASLGPALHARITAALPHRPAAVALAVREYESWLVAGTPTSSDVPDEARAGKAWLAQIHGRYVETIDQPRLTASMDLERAHAASRSFRHWSAALNRLRSSLKP